MSSSKWVAQQEGLQQICQLLVEHQQAGADFKLKFQRLQQLSNVPDFSNYLAYIFGYGQGLEESVRQGAGLWLKNWLKQKYWQASKENKDYLKETVLPMIKHENRSLRQTAGTIAATIITLEGFEFWKQLLASLVNGLKSTSSIASQEGAMDTIVKIAEDCPQRLSEKVAEADTSVGDGIFPLIVGLLNSTDQTRIAQATLHGMNTIFTNVSLPESSVDGYATSVFMLASKGGSLESVLRRLVCIAMVNFIALRPDKLEAHMGQVIEYIIKNMQDDDHEVATEASEFWSAFADSYSVENDVLRPYLTTLVPILIKNTVYEDSDENVIEAELAEEAALQNVNVPDSVSSIKPHSSSKQHSTKEIGDAENGFEDNNEEGDDDGGLGFGEWNLRKSSAKGLDYVSNLFESENFLQIALPVVQQKLESSDWKQRESAILTLGAISFGCRDGLWVHLKSILGLLIRNVGDERPMIRINACWALSRYIDRVLETVLQGNPFSLQQQQILMGTRSQQEQEKQAAIEKEGQEMLQQVLEALLTRLRDKNKIVQCRVCNQVSSLLDEAQYYDTSVWKPYAKGMLQTFVDVMEVYDQRALRELYDTIGQCCLGFKSWLSSEENYNILIPAIMSRWRRIIRMEQNVVEMDREAKALIECMRYIVVAFSNCMQQQVQEIYDSSLQVLGVQLQSRHAQICGQPHSIPFDENLSAATIELISCLVEEFGDNFPQICHNTATDLMVVMLEFCKDSDAQIRQLAYGFLGDVAQYSFQILQPQISEALELAMRAVDSAVKSRGSSGSPSHDAADTNAVWSLGQMMVQIEGEQLAAHAMTIMQLLVPIVVNSKQYKRSTGENAAIALGRLAMKSPQQVAQHSGHFGGLWCSLLAGINDNLEKAHAFKGLLAVIQLNTSEASKFFVSFMAAVASWRQPYDDALRQSMGEALLYFKKLMQDNWQSIVQQSNPNIIAKLSSEYGI